MIAEKLLSRLDKVKQHGADSWLACCPAHDDKNPSLAISEKDGIVLLHCFSGGCDVASIVESVGLTISDLYPEQIPVEGNKPIQRERFPAHLILKALSGPITTCEVVCMAIQQGKEVAPHQAKMASEAAMLFHAGRKAGGYA